MSHSIELPRDPAAGPFKLAVEPELRACLRGTLLDLTPATTANLNNTPQQSPAASLAAGHARKR